MKTKLFYLRGFYFTAYVHTYCINFRLLRAIIYSLACLLWNFNQITLLFNILLYTFVNETSISFFLFKLDSQFPGMAFIVFCYWTSNSWATIFTPMVLTPLSYFWWPYFSFPSTLSFFLPQTLAQALSSACSYVSFRTQCKFHFPNRSCQD